MAADDWRADVERAVEEYVQACEDSGRSDEPGTMYVKTGLDEHRSLGTSRHGW